MARAWHRIGIKGIAIVLTLILMGFNTFAKPGDSSEIEELRGKTLEELMNIKITSASKQPDKISEIPASAVIITREDIQNYGYATLEEILESVPGFYQVDDWQAEGTSFGVRGFWTNTWNRNIAILVNGVRQNDDFNSTTTFATLNVPVEAIKKIEIVRGPMAVIYGSGAFFGVVNIVTNEVAHTEQTETVSASIGSNNSYGVFASSEGSENDYQYVFNSSIEHTDGPDVPYSKMGGAGSYTSKGHLETTAKYFSFTGILGNLKTSLSLDETSSAKPFFFQPSTDYDGNAYYTATRIAMDYTRKPFEIATIVAKLSYNHFELEYDYDTDLDPSGTPQWEVQDVKSSSYTAELNAFIHPTPDLSITAGLEYHSAFRVYTTYDLPMFDLSNVKESIGDDQIVTQALFTQVKYHTLDNLLLIGGLRLEQMLPYQMHKAINVGIEHLDPNDLYDINSIQGRRKYDRDDIIMVPRIAAIYSFNSRNILKLLYGQAINHPSYYTNRDIVLDPLAVEIKPEKVRTGEINYISILNDQVEVSINAYHSNFNNLISRSTGFYENGDYYSRWDNSGEMSVIGTEIQALLIPFRNLSVDVSYAYQDVVNDNMTSREVAFSPDGLGYMKLLYTPVPKITIGLTGKYVSEMVAQWDPGASDPNDPNSPPVGRLGDPVDSYHHFNFNLRIQDFLINGSSVGIHVANILDTDIFYPATSGQNWAQHGTLGAGRSVRVRVGLEF
jgi:outer membrane cobalamin receptor